MTYLKHTLVDRIALSKTPRRRRDRYVTISSSNREDADDPGYIELVDTNTIRAGKGWSVVVVEISDKDFSVLIDKMMQAHPQATIRAIGAALAEFQQPND